MITYNEALTANEFYHVSKLNADKTPMKCRRNGKTKTCQTYIEALYFILKITPLQEKLEKVENILYNFSHLPYKNKWIVKLSNIEKELTNNIEELETDFKNNIKNEYFKILQKEYKYLASKEAIIETIEANEYKFTIDGKIK